MIENTADRDPLLHLAGAFGGMDRYVGEMEASGQRQLLHSDRLPTEVNHGSDDEFLALGFQFGEPDRNDPMFRPASLPEGWKREGSEHAMWSYIVDTNGRRRVAIFYKAAFYDRKAFMHTIAPDDALTELLWSDKPAKLPVDAWTPREYWLEKLPENRDALLAEAEEMDSYYAKGAAQRREQAAICDRELARLQESAS